MEGLDVHYDDESQRTPGRPRTSGQKIAVFLLEDSARSRAPVEKLLNSVCIGSKGDVRQTPVSSVVGCSTSIDGM